MSKKKPTLKETSIEEIIPDDKNMNKGSLDGQALINHSIRKLGTGRSILIDKNNRTIAGNKTASAFKANGKKRVVVVEADADTLIAVKRTDIDLDSKEGREMALADNQTSAISYVADEEMIEAVVEELDIDKAEWGLPVDEETHKKKLKEEGLRPFKKTHILLSFSPEKILELQEHLEAIKKIEGVEYEQGSN
jgi:hypothetical protein